ncbi:hypothetical protein RhiTH_007472 [Rhizoctonia solani]
MEPQLPSATSVKYGKVSLKQVTQLLLGLLSQVERLEREIAEIKEAGVETRTNVKNISQTVDVVKDGLKTLQLQGPRTPEGPQPKAVEETPRPIPKDEPTGTTSRTPFWSEAPRAIPGLAQPTPRRVAPPRVPSPPPSPLPSYPNPVKVDHPDAYTGKIGSEAKQWLTRMLAWTRLNSCMFPTDQEVLSFLLMNMKDSAGAWAHCQFARGLHWEVSRQIATRKHRPRTLLELQNAALVINNALREERASHLPKDSKSSRPSNPTRGTSTGQSSTGSKKLSDNPNFVSEEEQNRHRAAGACIKCGKMGHKFAECRTGWKATPIKEKGKAKETAKIGKDSESQLGKE